MEITYSQRVKVADGVLVRVLGDEAVLLNLETKAYYGLDEVGTRIWTVLTESGSVQEAYDILLAEYEVDAETLREDLDHLLEELFAQGLLEAQAS